MNRPTTHTDLYQQFTATRPDFRNANLAELLLTYLKGNSVLDVGCGYGLLLGLAHLHGYAVEGIEPDAKLRTLAQAQYPTLTIHPDAVENFSPPGQYDTVVAADILECVPDYRVTLAALTQLVKPGGRLLLVAPALPWLFGSRDRMMGYHRRFSRAQLLSALADLGLTIRLTRYWNAILVLPYLLLYKFWGSQSHYEKLRSHPAPGRPAQYLSALLLFWFRQVENRFSLGIGLSLIVVAESESQRGADAK